MHSMHVLSIEEAHNWIQECSLGYTGHQRAEVRRAIKNELASLDSYLEHLK
ncbi:hypothetical protein [Alteromonas sp. RW2A1]|uniref:hypothetical protein n=1 Tax=Alteromonas sp. RW2A1 TaxID=1917158 RepID=UPI0012EC06E0|nr:hypothetical protein [Alteromonas sp. RW2A1]